MLAVFCVPEVGKCHFWQASKIMDALTRGKETQKVGNTQESCSQAAPSLPHSTQVWRDITAHAKPPHPTQGIPGHPEPLLIMYPEV